MFKGFKPQGLQKIASKMGYAGRMEEFDNYLQQNPDKQREMITFEAKAQEMARGGAVVRMAVGGMPSYVNPITPPTDPNNPFGPVGAAVMSYGYNPKTNQYSISGGGGQSFPEGFESSMNYGDLYKKYPQIKGSFEAGVPASIPGGEYDPNDSFGNPMIGKPYDQPDTTFEDSMTPEPMGNVPIINSRDPVDFQKSELERVKSTLPPQSYDQEYRRLYGILPQNNMPQQQQPVRGQSPAQQQDRRANSLPDYEAFKKYQSTIPNGGSRIAASVIVPRRLEDGTVINFGNPIQAEDYDNYLKSIGKSPTTSVNQSITNLGSLPSDPRDPRGPITSPVDIADSREEFMDYFKLPNGDKFAYDRRTRMAVPPGAVGVSKDEYMQLPDKPTDYTSLQSSDFRQPSGGTTNEGYRENLNIQQPTGPNMATDTNIEDFSVQQALNPTLPQGGATVAADTPINQAQMVNPNTGQLSPTGASVPSATLATNQTSTAPTPTDAAQTNAALSNLQVASTVAPIQGAQGAVSQQAQLNAQQQAASSVSQLQSAQGVANVMQNPVQRQIQSGELVTGAANAQAASTFAEQIEAATATPSTQATTQGQLAGLTANFDASNPPAWAAGALRGIQAQMASRGLGASSMAAQAMVQGALESALPIAQADANTIASFEQANLSNRQQRAMLSAQQRATFIGQEFDQAFQSRVQNAAKIGDIANMNFTAEQNIALENSNAANTMNLTNLGNKQAMVIAEASALANLDLSNLNNRQQAAVQNAQSFMQMDMSNLNNTQQAEMFKAQSLVQSLFNDQAASNASNQFNATSQNQTDQFFANLATTVSNFNAEQGNAMSRYNSGEVNALAQFNSTMKNQREQFNSQNRLVIDQSNAQWRRQVATSDTATINRVNEINAKSLLDLSTGAYNNLWQGFRDDMEFSWKSADNAQERAKDITLRKMQDESSVAAAALTADAAFSSSVGSSVLGLATNNITGPAIGGVVESGANWLWDAGSSIIDSIFG